MTVVMLEPGKEAYIAEIRTSLEEMRKVVGGYIQALYPWEDSAAIVCNEDGKLEGLPLNRSLYLEENGGRTIYDIIAAPRCLYEPAGWWWRCFSRVETTTKKLWAISWAFWPENRP